MTVIHTDAAPKAVGPYSQAIASGALVFCSGQLGMDPVAGKLVEGGVAAQAEQVLDNMEAVLAAAGLGLADVVKTTVVLKDMNDFGAMNEVYGRRFGDHKPARSTIQVARLPLDGLVEIECIAAT